MDVQRIQCMIGQNNILFPTNNSTLPNIEIVTIECSISPNSEKTGILSWGGSVMAFLTYDPSGFKVISYVPTVHLPHIQSSIENILQSL